MHAVQCKYWPALVWVSFTCCDLESPVLCQVFVNTHGSTCDRGAFRTHQYEVYSALSLRTGSTGCTWPRKKAMLKWCWNCFTMESSWKRQQRQESRNPPNTDHRRSYFLTPVQQGHTQEPKRGVHMYQIEIPVASCFSPRLVWAVF